MSGRIASTMPRAIETSPVSAHKARSPASSPLRNAIATSTMPVTNAHAAIQIVSTSAVMPGHASAAMPATMSSSASNR